MKQLVNGKWQPLQFVQLPVVFFTYQQTSSDAMKPVLLVKDNILNICCKNVVAFKVNECMNERMISSKKSVLLLIETEGVYIVFIRTFFHLLFKRWISGIASKVVHMGFAPFDF